MARLLTVKYWKDREVRNCEVIKHLVLDVGNVLMHPGGPKQDISERLQKNGINPEIAWETYSKYQIDLDLGKVDYEEVLKEYNEQANQSLTLEEYFTKLFDSLDLNTELIDFCKRSKLKKSILSNNHKWNHIFLEKYLKLSEWATVQVYSYEHGVRKPDSKLFKIFLDKIEESPEECLLIDDKDNNCKAAETLGMKTILFTGNEILPELAKYL